MTDEKAQIEDTLALADALGDAGVERGYVGGDVFRQAVARRLLASDWLAARLDRERRDVAEAAWDEGYTSGHSNAMRRMSDEPNAPTTPNPHREEADRCSQ